MPESALEGRGCQGNQKKIQKKRKKKEKKRKKKEKKKKKKNWGGRCHPPPGTRPDPPDRTPPPGLSTPHLCGQTDACKNITLATTSLRPVINQIDTSIIEHVLTGLTLYLSKFFQK